MERPAHLMVRSRRLSPRTLAAAGALLFEAMAIYAIATALTFRGIHFFPHTVMVDFFKTRPPPVHPVPVPQLKLVRPPTPIVPPPEIRIQTPKPPPRIKVVARTRPRPVMQTFVQVAARPAPPAPAKAPGITAPVSIGAPHTCERQYPPTAVRLNQQGTTVIWLMVNTDGSVSDVRVARSSGHEMLDEAAIRCAASWRYRPALENGRAVAASWMTNVQWKLQNGSVPM